MADDVDIAMESAIVDEEFARKERERVAEMRRENRTEDCILCGEFIPIARQEALGGTDLCTGCSEVEEIEIEGLGYF